MVFARTVLLIDDVMTTGSTVNECAKMMKLAGAYKVFCAVAAKAVFSGGRSRKMTEILAPVGGRKQLEAAVRSGADAVYFGAKDFNARRNAEISTRFTTR